MKSRLWLCPDNQEKSRPARKKNRRMVLINVSREMSLMVCGVVMFDVHRTAIPVNGIVKSKKIVKLCQSVCLALYQSSEIGKAAFRKLTPWPTLEDVWSKVFLRNNTFLIDSIAQSFDKKKQREHLESNQKRCHALFYGRQK